ncbi:MAG: hypothetical protein H6832_05355 [Planctomycetes bacterium]|nr:hypothetical protein [Planctomycetota bacterium]MCB9917809.1 hypothetical protein [Planctomycetota bacterium]
MSRNPRSTRQHVLACLVLLALPALLLFESLFLGNDFVPFDHRVFPPASVVLDDARIAELRAEGNWDITEKTMLVVPEFDVAKQELEAGRIPHFNPYVRSGAPLFANVLDGFASPMHAPLFFGRTEARFGIVAFIAFSLAGLCMFGFLRELGVALVASLFGAIVFQLSGTLAANAHFYMRMETLAWLPAGFWALERHAKTGSWRSAIVFALVLALTWLAGFPPYALVCCIAFGGRMAWIVIEAMIRRGVGPASRSALALGTATVLGLGLAAVQLVPMLDYFPESQRNLSQSLDELVSQGIDPLALLGFAMPYPFGTTIGQATVPIEHNPLLHWFWTRTSPSSGRLFWPISYNHTEYALTIGVLPVVCVIASLFARVRFRILGSLALVIAFLLATGGLLFQAATRALPALASTPPSRFVGVCCFFAAVLAGIGFGVLVDRFQKLGRRTTATLCIAACATVLAFALAMRGLADDPPHALAHMIEKLGAHWKTSYPDVAGDPKQLEDWFGPYVVESYRRFANSLLVAALSLFAIAIWLVSLPLATDTRYRTRFIALVTVAITLTAGFRLAHARHLAPSFPAPLPGKTIDTNPVVEFLRKQRSDHAPDGGFMVARVAERASLAIPLPPNLLMKEHIRDLNSYAFVDANSHRPFVELYGPGQMVRQYWVQALPADERLSRGLFDLVGVRYWLSTKRFELLGEPVFTFEEGKHAQTYVYENQGALPRAWLVKQAKRATTDVEVIVRIIAEDFDPRTELWLHDVPPSVISGESTDKGPSDATVRFVRDEPTSLRIAVENSPGAWLVLSDAVFSHWNASIDGQATAWHRANLMQRALFVPPGTHEIGFDYDPAPFRYGGIASIIALVACIVLFIVGRKKRPPEPAPPVLA